MKKILLTGGNGFIGKNIQESFLADKYEIVAPRSFELNLLDTGAVDNYFKNNKFDIVLHSACKPGHRNAKDTSSLLLSNLRIFENLVRHKDKYEKFINFGSGAIYDTSTCISNASEDEIFTKMGKDEHSFCKYIMHKRIQNLENFIDLNIFGIYGKYEDWQIRFISNAIYKAIFDIPITLRQNRKFSYLYINDLMPILEFFIENNVKYKSYNVVPEEKVELKDIAEQIQELSGKNTPIHIAKPEMGNDYTGNNTRLRNEFVNLTFTTFKNSLLSLYNYYNKEQSIEHKQVLLVDK